MKNKKSKKENEAKKEGTSNKFSFLNLAQELMADLQPRSQKIVQKRFGFFSKKGETLESIGQSYNITRERVRQIISEAVKSVSQKSDMTDFVLAEDKIIFTIIQNGGIIKEVDAISQLKKDDVKEINAIKFFVSCSKRIFEFEEKDILEKSWVVSNQLITQIKKMISEAEKLITQENKLLLDGEIVEKLALVLPAVSSEKIVNILSVSARVKKNKFGKWGMIDWMEVSPKGTRERVYMALKEHSKPLHFTKIAELINEYKLSKKNAHPQTVHNELIKDSRFVLVGRGIYALEEWGYFSGTIKDIIEVILKTNGRAMKKDEIVEKVLKMRKVKKTTVMINLNNRNFFRKEGEFYKVKK